MLDSLLDKEYTDTDVLEALFLQALCWSLGAGLLEDGRVKFDNYVKYLASLPTNDSDTYPIPAGGFLLDRDSLLKMHANGLFQNQCFSIDAVEILKYFSQ